MLYAEDLVQNCGHEGCDCIVGTAENPMYFNSNCHRGKPLLAAYYDGQIDMWCAECGQLMAQIAVASRGGTLQ
jgi:hypothetical protein